MSGSTMPPGVVADAGAAARALLRLQGDDDDAVLASLAATALGIAEAYLGQAIVRRGFEDVATAGAGWRRLAVAPVVAILGLTALPADGAPFVLPVDAYGYDIEGDGTGFVRVIDPGAAGQVAIAYTAGLAAGWADLPAPIAQGVAMLVAHLFADRSGDGVPPAAVAALKAAPDLTGVRVFDAPPVRGGVPYIIVEESVLADWSTKSWTGHEGQIALTIADAGERPVRLRGLADAAEAALGAIDPAIGGGWRLVQCRLTRSRLQRLQGDRWRGGIEFQVRLYREDA